MSGVAVWWELLARYHDAGYMTLKVIVYRYCCAGRENRPSAPLPQGP